MSQPATVEFSPLHVAEARSETAELTHLRLRELPEHFRRDYRVPGQYVQVKIGEHKPGFFAIACGPGDEHLELLVKRGTPIGDALAHVKAGDSLSVSPPMGKGYPMEQAAGRDLFIVGVGSGMAPLRAVVHGLLKERDRYQRVWFIYGARTPVAIPYKDEQASWRAQRIDVLQVCSQPESSTWDGPVGRVHDLLLERKPSVASSSAVFVCGMKKMVEDVREAFTTLGLPADRIFQNF